MRKSLHRPDTGREISQAHRCGRKIGVTAEDLRKSTASSRPVPRSVLATRLEKAPTEPMRQIPPQLPPNNARPPIDVYWSDAPVRGAVRAETAYPQQLP